MPNMGIRKNQSEETYSDDPLLKIDNAVNIKMKGLSVFNQDFSEEVENDVEVGGLFFSRSRFHQ